jgi:hypothetical protein
MARFSWLSAATENGEWRIGIGDPTPIGWFTVFAYLAVTLACGLNWAAERRRQRRGDPSSPLFWLGMSGMLLFLGVNKQLDLQTLLGEVGRRMAKDQGWYARRTLYQALFIAGLAIAGLIALAALMWLTRKQWKRCILPLVGTVFLFVFVLTRATSIHHFDLLLFSGPLGLHWNWIMELGGISVVGLGAVLALKGRGARPQDWTSGPKSTREPIGPQRFTFERGVLVPLEEPRRPPAG